jgi:hypothetical protein
MEVKPITFEQYNVVKAYFSKRFFEYDDKLLDLIYNKFQGLSFYGSAIPNYSHLFKEDSIIVLKIHQDYMFKLFLRDMNIRSPFDFKLVNKVRI